MRLRSLLYVPAHVERFVARAHERGADAIILDLEDAVPPAEKDRARAGLAEAVTAVGRMGAKVFVRINADAERTRPDAEAVCRAGAFGIFLPKVGEPGAIGDLADFLAPIETGIGRAKMRFVALIEHPAGVLDARVIARAPRVMALATGSEDLALAMGAAPTPEVLRYPKLLVHYAAKAEGLLSLGLLRSIADYADLDAVRMAAEEARAFGFDGATCVHPGAVPLLNEAFNPSREEIAWAERVAAAAEAQPGVLVIDGKMVDAPVVTRARAILAKAGRDI
jgi:citrate lyase subunit beta/citryl-CoA lyase